MAVALMAVVTMLSSVGCGSLGGRLDDGRTIAQIYSEIDAAPYSRLNDKGIDEVKRRRILKLDVRTGVVRRESVDLVDTEIGIAIGDPSGQELLLAFDAPKGREIVESATIMVGLYEGSEYLQDLTYWQAVNTLEEAFTQLRDGISRWGFNAKMIEGWIDEVDQFYRNEGAGGVLSMGISPTGLVNEVQIDYEPGKPIALKYTLYLAPTIYEPANLEHIRQTGRAVPEFRLSVEDPP